MTRCVSLLVALTIMAAASLPAAAQQPATTQTPPPSQTDQTLLKPEQLEALVRDRVFDSTRAAAPAPAA